MRRLLLTSLLLLVISARLSADCAGSGIWVILPRGEFISPNSVFVLELYGTATELITQTGATGAIYLSTQPEGKDVIPNTPRKNIGLEVIRLFTGDMYTSQVMLRPEEALQTGVTYFLMADSNASVNLFESFTIVGSLDNTRPEWKCAPQFGGSVYKMFGCGPEAYINFCCLFSEPKECLVVADVKEMRTGIGHKAFLYADSSGHTMLGRTMCGGMYDLSDTVKYTATFNLMDACGNINDTIHATYEFWGPAVGEITEHDCDCNSYSHPTDDSVKGDSNFTRLQFIAICGGAVLGVVAILLMVVVNRNRRN